MKLYKTKISLQLIETQHKNRHTFETSKPIVFDEKIKISKFFIVNKSNTINRIQ